MLEEMRPALKRAGINDAWINSRKDDPKIKEIYEAYKIYQSVRNLLSEEQWSYYALQNITDTREQILHNEAKKEFRRAWQTTFKKHDKKSGAASTSPDVPGPETGQGN